MLYELREYHLRFEGVNDFLKTVESVGVALFHECGGQILGAWLPEVGTGTATVYTWLCSWPDLNARQETLQAFRSHPKMPAFQAGTRQHIVRIDTRILRPLPFSPMT